MLPLTRRLAPHRHGVVLFRHPASPRPYTDLRPLEEARRRLAAFWIGRAARFLAAGRSLLRQGEDSGLEAARNARWAAEWYLRGYFTARGIHTGKVHDFRELRRHAARKDPELAEALAIADALARYPRPFELRDAPGLSVSEAEARDALRRAERVGALVRERVGTE